MLFKICCQKFNFVDFLGLGKFLKVLVKYKKYQVQNFKNFEVQNLEKKLKFKIWKKVQVQNLEKTSSKFRKTVKFKI